MSERYKLVGQTPVLVEDLLEWAEWLETANRRVAYDEPFPGVRVSTVFLGVNDNFLSDEPPALFETMVFGGSLDMEQERYSTWAEAETGHKRWLERVKAEP